MLVKDIATVMWVSIIMSEKHESGAYFCAY